MIPRMLVDKIKELKVVRKGSGILGGDHSIYGSRLFKIMIISRSFSCGLEMMLKFNMLGRESAKAYLKSIYSWSHAREWVIKQALQELPHCTFGYLWYLMATQIRSLTIFDQLRMAFKDLLALAARYAGGWSALLAGRQGLLDTSLPKVPGSTAQDSLFQHGSTFARYWYL